VPFIVSWPGNLPKAAVCSEPVISTDIMPTILAAAAVELPGDRVYDGKDMLAALRGETTEPLHKALFWYDGAQQWAVRAGKWKLLSRKGSLLEGIYAQWRSQMGEQISKLKTRTRP
jgi:arylsulfatase A-like enzyme